MVETIGGAIGVAVGFYLIFLSFRRYWRMTPEQRELHNIKRDVRELKKEKDRRRWA